MKSRKAVQVYFDGYARIFNLSQASQFSSFKALRFLNFNVIFNGNISFLNRCTVNPGPFKCPNATLYTGSAFCGIMKDRDGPWQTCLAVWP